MSCIGLLAGATAVAAPAGIEARAQPAEFSVVTFNLYHDSADWPRRRVQVLATFRRLAPDAIVLQEVLQHESLPNQAAWLARELGYEYRFVTTDPPSHKRRYGIALLTRHPLVEEGETLLHPLEDHRTAGFARLLVDGQPLNLYYTHLYWKPDGAAIRARQVADLLAYVEATSGEAPSLLAGDFNAEADAPELAALLPGWEDAWLRLDPRADTAASSTLNPAYFSTPARVDHVFLPRGRMRPLEARLLFAEPDADGLWASDHRAVYVRLRLPPVADTATEAAAATEAETEADDTTEPAADPEVNKPF
ncbi:endonuclease [Pseudoxanthomonas koreensis]|nr:endonuclease [Pseudoxanthomonas koreensis]